MTSAILKATKLTFIFINILFVFLGLAAIAVGSWVLVYREEVRALTMIDLATLELGLLQNAAILLITSGLVLFALGFVGCGATYKNQRCMQAVYIGLVVLCLLVTACACAVAFIFREKLEDDLVTYLETKLKTEYQGFSRSTLDFSQAWDYAQIEFQCCGIRSQDDYALAMNWTVRNSATVPLSCCVQLDRDAFLDDNVYTVADVNCPQFPNSTNSFIDTPCHGELKEWMEWEITIMGGVAIAAIALQLLALLFVLCIMRQRPKSSTSMLYRDTASSY